MDTRFCAVQGTLPSVLELRNKKQFYELLSALLVYRTLHGDQKPVLKKQIFFPLQCHHMPFLDFVVLPLGHGRSVTDF